MLLTFFMIRDIIRRVVAGVTASMFFLVCDLPYGGWVGPRPFWVGLVGPLFEISFFPGGKVFKYPGGWVSQITPCPPPPLPYG